MRAQYLLQVSINLIKLPLLGASVKESQCISSMNAVDWYVGLLKCCFRKAPDLSTLGKHRVTLQILALARENSSKYMWRPAVPPEALQGRWVSQSALLLGIPIGDPCPGGMQPSAAS